MRGSLNELKYNTPTTSNTASLYLPSPPFTCPKGFIIISPKITPHEAQTKAYNETCQSSPVKILQYCRPRTSSPLFGDSANQHPASTLECRGLGQNKQRETTIYTIATCSRTFLGSFTCLRIACYARDGAIWWQGLTKDVRLIVGG